MQHDQKYTGQDFKVVGSRPNRPDGIDKVTGRARYGADMSAPGQLVGLMLYQQKPNGSMRAGQERRRGFHLGTTTVIWGITVGIMKTAVA